MNNEYIKVSDLAFYITKEDVQYEANEKLNRELNYLEMEFAQKYLQSGIMTPIDIIFNTTFKDIKDNPERFYES